MIIKPHRRTIYFQKSHSLSVKEILKKYVLNIPKIKFNIIRYDDGDDAFYVKILDENDKECYAPFTNIHSTGRVCMGDEYLFFVNEKEFANQYFNTIFTVSLVRNIQHYLKIDVDDNLAIDIWSDAIDEFYTNWQETGKLNLIRKNKC